MDHSMCCASVSSVDAGASDKIQQLKARVEQAPAAALPAALPKAPCAAPPKFKLPVKLVGVADQMPGDKEHNEILIAKADPDIAINKAKVIRRDGHTRGTKRRLLAFGRLMGCCVVWRGVLRCCSSLPFAAAAAARCLVRRFRHSLSRLSCRFCSLSRRLISASLLPLCREPPTRRIISTRCKQLFSRSRCCRAPRSKRCDVEILAAR